jgi:Fur family transcriptional regulator, iron response regulator
MNIKKIMTPPVRREDVPAALASLGIAVTAQRIEIGAILLESMQHLSAEQVQARLEADGASASKATVYNTLGLFAKKGLVRELVIDGARVFYDSNPSDHFHFYNVDDGTLFDFPSSPVTLTNLPTPPEGTKLDKVDVIVRVTTK